MEPNSAVNIYFIWGIDEEPYGPVELPVLLDWIKDDRVLPETWVFSHAQGSWQHAADLPELKHAFGLDAELNFQNPLRKIAPGSLRRIKVLADLNNDQLIQLASYLEIQDVPQWTVLFKQGDGSDSMFMVMSGEIRARLMNDGKETILATFGPGEFFGDMALFDHGPRSADVVANVDSTLLKITATAFYRLTREAPALATPFLQATVRTLSARIRTDNKRLDRVTQQYAAGSGL